jgi:hypothetical protein
MKAILLLALALVGCNTYDASLLPGLSSVCLWRGTGVVTAPVQDDASFDCYRVTAPEHARVSPVEINACEAEAVGMSTVTVRRGEAVWKYAEPDFDGAGSFRTKWVACGE